MQLKPFLAILIFGMTLFAAANSVCADIFTNFSAVADTGLFEPNPTYNLGGLPDFPVGLTAGVHGTPLRCRGLVRFDLTQLPTNTLITSVELTVQVVKQSAISPGSVVALHRLLVDWGEGSGSASAEGVPAKPGEATWVNRFHPATAWALPGGAANQDYVNAFSATNFISGLGTFVFRSSPGMVLDVQTWVSNPQTNFGWLFRDLVETTIGSGRRFASRESLGGNGPRLTVQYQLPARLLSLRDEGLLGDHFHFSFDAESNSTYTVEVRDALSAGSWRPLTNIPNQAVASPIQITDPVARDSAFYRVGTP